jgi:precorrin-6A/cobalt-precorrin-6A reductase
MNVLVMAGTGDAVQIIKMLTKDQKSILIKNDMYLYILATTTTDYGAQLAEKAGADEVISKPLNKNDLVELIQKREIKILIDATHPFAAEATRNGVYAAKKTDINYIRYERPSLEIENSSKIHKSSSFIEAGKLALQISQESIKNYIKYQSESDNSLNSLDEAGRILHLAGVSTLEDVLKHVNKNRLFVRVLPTVSSIKKCFDLGLSGGNILAMQGVFSKEFNTALMKEYNVSAIITKESGEMGGVPSKIKAANDLGIDIILVTRPKIDELDQEIIVGSLEDLKLELNDLLS